MDEKANEALPPGLVRCHVYEAGRLFGAVAWSPNGELLAAGGMALNVWRMGEDKPAYEFHGGSGIVDLAWAPNSQSLVVGCDRAAFIDHLDGSGSRRLADSQAWLRSHDFIVARGLWEAWA